MNALRSISHGNFMCCPPCRPRADRSSPIGRAARTGSVDTPGLMSRQSRCNIVTAIVTTYHEVYQRALKDPEAFWGQAAEGISWIRRWDRVLDTSRPPFVRWFGGGVLNTCYNAVDRHIERGRGKQRAL